MSPPLPAPVQFGINEHLTDERVILLLGRRRIGNLPLTNLITGVNPFNIEPLNSSEELWYAYKSENPRYPNRRNAITETKSGFWRQEDVCRIFTNTTWVVRKTTMVFYEGKVPFGNITRWMMHEYQAEKEKLNGFNNEMEYNSFCRVFMQNYKTYCMEHQYSDSGDCVMQLVPKFQEQEQLPSIDDMLNRFPGQSTFAESLDEPVNEIAAKNINATCDFLIGDDYLELNDFFEPDTFSGQRSTGEQGQQSLSGTLDVPLNEIVANDIYSGDFLEMNDLCNSEASSIPWNVSVDEQQQSAFSESLAKSFNKNIAEDIYATDEFSNGDYLELNDLCSQGTSSRSSDNSSRMSVDSYDYFDGNALLYSRDEGNLRVEELSESTQIVFGTPQPGVVDSDSDTVAEESKLVSSLPGNGISCQDLDEEPELALALMAFVEEEEEEEEDLAAELEELELLIKNCRTPEIINDKEDPIVEVKLADSMASASTIVFPPQQVQEVDMDRGPKAYRSYCVSSSFKRRNPTKHRVGLPTSSDELHYKRNDPKAGKSEGIQIKLPAGILQGGSSMQGKGLKKASKIIAKLGKKYCCFGSF